MSILFSPIRFRSLTLKNRLVVSPMCQYSSIDGFANDWHLVHLGSRAVGGAGLVFTEATAVSPEGRITPDDLGIWKDEHIDFLQRITAFIEQQGSIPGIQLAHAGRKASHHSPWKSGKALQPHEHAWHTVAPSPIPFTPDEPRPKEMGKQDIETLIDHFVTAAQRAAQAGFKVVEIHAAHGYLINEFLSPASNHRTDEYGGRFENRIRLLLEIVSAVREIWNAQLPLFVRISATEWTDTGWSLQDSVRLSQILRSMGVDLIDCSSGGNAADQKITAGPLYQIPFAEKIRQEAGIPTGGVGLITTAQECEQILQNHQADLIFMARQLLRDPYFPLRSAAEFGEEITWPNQYLRAKTSGNRKH